MAMKYLDLAMTESVCRAQRKYYGHAATISEAPTRDLLSEAEVEFIAARDSFYLGTISESGWPYIQHRGGPVGFLRVINRATLAFADYTGNRQLLSTGNIDANDRVALFLMDYKNRERLKVMGHARIEDPQEHADLVATLEDPNLRKRVERVVVVDVVSFDWNCPKYISPRYSIGDVDELVDVLRARIEDLETQLRAVKP